MGEAAMVSPGNKRRVQVRKVRAGGFCAPKRQVFLDHLAGCCNIRMAAEAAGISTVTIDYHRRRDPVFAQQCAEAIEAGYFALEAMAMAEAANGAGGHYVPGPDAGKAPGPEGMNIEVALRLLAMRKAPLGRRTGRSGYEPRRASEKELDAAILAKLDVLDQRIKRERERKALRRRSGRAQKMGTVAGNCPRTAQATA